MKKTIKASSIRVLAIMLAMAVLMSAAAITASAFSLSEGMAYDGIGTVVSNTDIKSVAGIEGFDYNKTTFKDTKSYGQTMYALEFNPATTGLIPIAYQPKISYGSTVGNSAEKAIQEGYDVVAGINGEFFSMNSGNAGTLESRLITNGIIVADSEFRNDVCLAIDSNGGFNLVKSEMAYHVYKNGSEILEASGGNPIIGTVNKRYVGTEWWDPWCYFDYETGGNTYTNADVAGVEVVFEKLNGTELVVEGVLQGQVVSVNTNTYATAMTENQFVLYAQNGSANYDTLAGFKVGDKIDIYADELNKDAEQVMKNAVTVTSATYPIVVDGVDNTDNTPNASDIYATRAQRTLIGVKEDGTLVMVCTAGRGSSANYDYGMTLKKLAAMMIGLGCKHAVNLDGGGSSTMYLDGSTVYAAEGRAVASSILVCKRNDKTTSAAAKQELNDWIYNAATSSYDTPEQTANVQAAIAEAQAVYDDNNAKTGSMTGDFIRETLDLKAAMGYIKSYLPKNYISLKAEDWSYNSSIMTATNNADGSLVLANTNDQWPAAAQSFDVNVPAGNKLYFDITVTSQSYFKLTLDGVQVDLNPLIAPNNLDAGSGDIKAGVYKGSIDVSTIKSGGFNATSLAVCASGGKAQVIIREFAFRDPYSGGDSNGNGTVDSTDARALLRHLSGTQSLSADGQRGADANGDGVLNSDDIRYILKKRVGLI